MTMKPKNLYLVETLDVRDVTLEAILMWSTLTVDEIKSHGDNVLVVTDVYTVINNQKNGALLNACMINEGLRK